ncbi:MAG: ABC transporter ATP-binding protein [Spirochaetaceae bacterium]|nr:MAG: ABC transporter ATP-binding protein [Spirochaetaceae bacterium]
MTTLRFLLGYTRPYLAAFLVGMLLLLASSAGLLLFPFLTGKIVNDLLGTDPWIIQGAGKITLLLLSLLIVRAVVSAINSILFSKVSVYATADLRHAVYQRLIQLPMKFFDSRRTGELLSRITADVELLQLSFSFTAAELLRQVLILFFGLAAIFFITPRLTLFMLAIVPPVSIMVLVLGRAIRKRARETQDLQAEANIVVEETLQAVETVKVFSNEPLEARRYRDQLSQAVRMGMHTAIFRSAAGNVLVTSMLGGIVGIIWYGTTLISRGMLELGDLVTFILYTGFIGGSIAGLGNSITQLQKTVGACERLEQIMQEEPEDGQFAGAAASDARDAGGARDAGDARDTSKPDGPAIACSGLVFTYPTRPEQKVFNGLDFQIAPGEHVGLVGSSGAGKTSLFRLLLRLYNPLDGQICAFGQDSRSMALEEWRRKFALVPQEVILFGGSIRQNIAYGNPQATDEQIWQAAEQANAIDFIQAMPQGLDTRVGERGTQLSGGQRQRVAIARAVLRDPQILLLDEATSSLDSLTEKAVQEALEKLMIGRTTLVIAHRLTTVEKLQRILVMENGDIVEQGSPEVLLAKSQGYFRKMHQLSL